ncbi:MAG: glycosyltransferase [Gracilimonas sp.]
MESIPNITFIICTFNRAHYLDDTLQSILQQKTYSQIIEILVVDNNSTDNTYSIFQKHRDSTKTDNFILSYCKEREQGLSYARNRGISESKSENIVFLDDDVSLTKNFLKNWLHFFKTYPDYKAAGGKIIVRFDTKKPNWVSHFLLTLFGHHNLGNSIKPYPSNKHPFGGNMGFRKAIFLKTGIFNTYLGRKGEELTSNEEKDLFNRIKSENEPILYLPNTTLYHRIGAERLTLSYIKRQANGLGKSIAIEVHGSTKRTLNHFLNELFKTFVSLALLIVYTLGLRPAKGITLLKFRYWVLQGFLEKS